MANTAAAAESLSYAAARERVLSAVRTLDAVEAPLEECRGRALRQAVRARHDLPPFRNSSMDGYAVRASDVAAGAWIKVTAVIPAGGVAPRPLGSGEAMRIMTGAMLPEGADAVVPVELVQREALDTPGERVKIAEPVAAGQNVRDAGRDVRSGETVLESGRELSAHDLALLASLGEPRLMVSPRPRAAVISTGDELLDPGDALRPGAIRDGNRPMLVALLAECGFTVRASRVSDDPASVARAIDQALAAADVVITIGGVSAGDFDPVKQALGERGLSLWRVAMKPGRPQAFGAPDGKLFFGLPGNPASVACTFEALVRPALRKLLGFTVLERPRLRVRAAEAIESRAGRVDFVRVTLESRDDGWWAHEAGEQVSGHMAPQSRAHALLIVPADAASLARGDAADAILLRWPDSPA